MKAINIILIAVVIILTGCEKRKFEFVVTLNNESEYLVDQTGSFSKSAEVSKQNIMKDLDIPETATIKDVNIESLAVRVEVLPGNTAPAVSLSGSSRMGTQQPKLFNNQIFPLVGADIKWIGLNALIAEGIESVKVKIKAYLENKDSAPFYVDVQGDTSPISGNRIHCKVYFQIRATVVYENCEDAVPFTGDDCN